MSTPAQQHVDAPPGRSVRARRIRFDYPTGGFHPDDTDNAALLDHWAAELFGEHGALVGHLG